MNALNNQSSIPWKLEIYLSKGIGSNFIGLPHENQYLNPVQIQENLSVLLYHLHPSDLTSLSVSTIIFKESEQLTV